MKTGDAQVAVSEDGIIVAKDLSASPDDRAQLVPMLEAVEANTGERPRVALADKGYLTEKNLETLQRRGQRCLVAVGGNARSLPSGHGAPRRNACIGSFVCPGLAPGSAESMGKWNLVCAAFNLKAIWKAKPA